MHRTLEDQAWALEQLPILADLAEQLIELAAQKAVRGGEGVVGTWAALFRLSFGGEVPQEIVTARFAAVQPFLKKAA